MKEEIIVDVLKADHREVESLFRQVEKASMEAQQEQLFQRIAEALDIHAQGEEAVVYPRLEESEELSDYAMHSYDEHEDIREAIAEVDALDPSDKNWKDKVKKLKETVEHHVKEEENEIFPLMEKHFSRDDLREMGVAMRAAKDKYKKAS